MADWYQAELPKCKTLADLKAAYDRILKRSLKAHPVEVTPVKGNLA